MVTVPAVVPPETVVKNGVWPEVPAELVESVRVAAVAPLVITLPNWSWTWTAKGPTLAVALTVLGPDTVEVKASLLAAPATMVKPLVVVPVTV